MWTLAHAECREYLSKLPDNSADAVVTDTPYALTSESPDMAEVLQHWLAGDDYESNGGGFMGASWDAFVPGPATFREVFRVLKPGGYALFFGGTRTYDLLGVSLRLAGFRLLDTIHWMYGSGMVASRNVACDIDKQLGHPHKTVDPLVTTEAKAWEGWGTRIKPAHEPIWLAQKPRDGTFADNVLAHTTGLLNIDGCRTPAGRWPANVALTHSAACELRGTQVVEGDARHNTPGSTGGRRPPGFNQPNAPKGDSLPNGRVYGDEVVPVWVCAPDCPVRALDAQAPGSDGASRFFNVSSWHPELDDIESFRYAPKVSTAEREAGCGGLPAWSAAAATASGEGTKRLANPRTGAGRTGGRRNVQPTLKPIALLRWLTRLVTPPGGLVLDPFAGAASGGVAAVLEGFDWLGTEMCDDPATKPPTPYVTIGRARLRHWSQQRDGTDGQ